MLSPLILYNICHFYLLTSVCNLVTHTPETLAAYYYIWKSVVQMALSSTISTTFEIPATEVFYLIYFDTSESSSFLYTLHKMRSLSVYSILNTRKHIKESVKENLDMDDRVKGEITWVITLHWSLGTWSRPVMLLQCWWRQQIFAINRIKETHQRSTYSSDNLHLPFVIIPRITPIA